MSRRRRAAALLGLALVLGTLAASDVARREAALRRELGPAVTVVVTREAVGAGRRLRSTALAERRVPARYAPAGAYASAREVEGLRAAVAIPAGADLEPALLDDGSSGGPAGPALAPGQRLVQVVAVGDAGAIVAGGRVDVLVTRERSDGGGATTLALEDVEVLSSSRAAAAGGADAGADLPRVALGLRVTLRQAVFLAAAQSFARELRALARGPGDRRRGAQGLRIDAGL